MLKVLPAILFIFIALFAYNNAPSFMTGGAIGNVTLVLIFFVFTAFLYSGVRSGER